MHEVGVAESIMKSVMTAVKQNGAEDKFIKEISINVGGICGVEPHSLEFALNCIKVDTIAYNATIKVNIIPARGLCTECGKYSTPETFFSICDHCGALGLDVVEGKDLEIDYVDMED